MNISLKDTVQTFYKTKAIKRILAVCVLRMECAWRTALEPLGCVGVPDHQ